MLRGRCWRCSGCRCLLPRLRGCCRLEVLHKWTGGRVSVISMRLLEITYLIFAVDPELLEGRMRRYLCCEGSNAGQDECTLHGR
jgi:hypothetical protein